MFPDIIVSVGLNNSNLETYKSKKILETDSVERIDQKRGNIKTGN